MIIIDKEYDDSINDSFLIHKLHASASWRSRNFHENFSIPKTFSDQLTEEVSRLEICIKLALLLLVKCTSKHRFLGGSKDGHSFHEITTLIPNIFFSMLKIWTSSFLKEFAPTNLSKNTGLSSYSWLYFNCDSTFKLYYLQKMQKRLQN